MVQIFVFHAAAELTKAKQAQPNAVRAKREHNNFIKELVTACHAQGESLQTQPDCSFASTVHGGPIRKTRPKVSAKNAFVGNIYRKQDLRCHVSNAS